MFRAIFALFFCLLINNAVHAQSPKREFRGAWIATVANIDWPSKPGLPAVEQQQEFIRQLDMLQSVGCNAVIVQVRPVCDAFYASGKEPWSHYLTGRQGEAPFPYYDPLVFMVEETHKRNMEFHAWFNPFRALMNSTKNNNPNSHVTHTHKDWIINYGTKSYIDPGVPEARDYVIGVIADVVKRYDVDAVHLDDYFYPYREPGKEFGDGRSYARYGNGMTKDDWRRDNVSRFISLLNTTIKDIKPYMKLGISPFGVWRNKSKDPEGSDTRGGQTTYDDLYADVLLWMQKGWVDYMMPQLYWEHKHKAAPFDVLQPWWYDHCYQRHVYYGLGLYRMTTAKSGPWATTGELMWQLRDIRGKCPNSGYSFYSASCFNKVKPAVKDSLQNSFNRYPALVPPMTWLDDKAPAAPVLKAAGNKLEWQTANPTKEPLRYVLYRFNAGEKVDLERNDRIISIQQETSFKDTEAGAHKQATYVVTALDRVWNESAASNTVKL
ncbi:MAG: family 10 glycosylhydrolase [Chitinophagaceae bacterium]|nr:family 10 glycosylhydrolase [Chitinophagaceae bacterium]